MERDGLGSGKGQNDRAWAWALGNWSTSPSEPQFLHLGCSILRAWRCFQSCKALFPDSQPLDLQGSPKLISFWSSSSPKPDFPWSSSAFHQPACRLVILGPLSTWSDQLGWWSNTMVAQVAQGASGCISYLLTASAVRLGVDHLMPSGLWGQCIRLGKGVTGPTSRVDGGSKGQTPCSTHYRIIDSRSSGWNLEVKGDPSDINQTTVQKYVSSTHICWAPPVCSWGECGSRNRHIGKAGNCIR